ncbi:glycosyltransferase [Cytobacillus solani]|uniref:glycosyltransferase n=1 Tax=Cytobacillus solani TaxID=1637975 RepID=UPI00094998A2|nr:glycosyltransferase [Cytobacillus solani]
MNENKICFIINGHDEVKYQESLKYINALIIPEGFEIEILTSVKHINTPAFYNTAMLSSDAKYKIYLEESTSIIDKQFLYSLISLFRANQDIGMVGAIGAKQIPETFNWIESNYKVGSVYAYQGECLEFIEYSPSVSGFEETVVLDRSILATQFDIPFCEEDLIYDLSQSVKFIENGYKIGVLIKDQPFVVLDQKLNNERSSKLPLDIKKINSRLNVEWKSDLPLVSILIPTYNRPDYFELALKSALEQTYENIEIIIGDDSTNNLTESLVKDKYLPYYNNIRYIRNETNLGQFDNDLKLMELSSGEYINFLMDDDLFHPKKIEKMMDYFINDKEREIVLVTSHRRLINEMGEPYKDGGVTQKVFKEDTIMDGIEFGNILLKFNFNFIGEPTTVLFRKKDLTEPFGTFAGRKYGCNVDSATWLTLLSKGKGVYISETLSFFRIHGNQQLQSEKMKVFGAIDYAHEIINARSYGFLGNKQDYNVSVLNCIDYSCKVLNSLPKIIDGSLIIRLKEKINKLEEIRKADSDFRNSNMEINNENLQINKNYELFKSLKSIMYLPELKGNYEKQMEYAKIIATSCWLAHNGNLVSKELEERLINISQNSRGVNGELNNKPIYQKKSTHIIHILTTAYETGGHTRLVERWIANRSDYDETHSVIILNQGLVPFPESLKIVSNKSGGFFMVLPANETLFNKSLFLRDITRATADKVIIHCHPNDPIPTVAFGIEDLPPILYLNHADHVFWLGVGISDVVLDLRESAQKLTLQRRLARKSHIVPIPLELKEIESTVYYKEKMNIPLNSIVLLTIASSFKFNKFQHHNFINVVVELLHENENMFFIIVGANQLDPDWQAAIRKCRGRLRIIKETPYIENYYKVSDIYLESFPIGSPTSALDAILFGKPVIRQPLPIASVLSMEKYQGMYDHANSITEYKDQIYKYIKNKNKIKESINLQYQDVCSRHIGEGWNQKLDKIIYGQALKHELGYSSIQLRKYDQYDQSWAELQMKHKETIDFLKSIGMKTNER